jgi:hypothetical protein
MAPGGQAAASLASRAPGCGGNSSHRAGSGPGPDAKRGRGSCGRAVTLEVESSARLGGAHSREVQWTGVVPVCAEDAVPFCRVRPRSGGRFARAHSQRSDGLAVGSPGDLPAVGL